jgi:hypothetical protein
VACTIRELYVHDEIPQCSVISEANMCHNPETSSCNTLPPQELVLRPPSREWRPESREAGSRESLEHPNEAPVEVSHAASQTHVSFIHTPLSAQSASSVQLLQHSNNSANSAEETSLANILAGLISPSPI